MLNGGAFCDAAHAMQRRRRKNRSTPRAAWEIGTHSKGGGVWTDENAGGYSLLLRSALGTGGFYFFSHTSGTSTTYCACHADLDTGPRRDHNDCMDMGLVHCSELGDFFSGAVGWLPCRQIFSGIFAGTLAPAAAIRYSSFVGWSLVSQS